MHLNKFQSLDTEVRGIKDTSFYIPISSLHLWFKLRRQSISFDKDVDEGVDKYRRATPMCTPVPSFSKAVNDLLREKLRENAKILVDGVLIE